MVEIERTAIVPYTTSQMFQLVNDVERYSDFLPWCSQVELLERTDSTLTAKVHFAKMGLHQSFTTKNVMVENEKIESNLVEGPFKTLHSIWWFEKLGSGCKVHYTISFEFASDSLAKLLNPLFGSITNSIVESFCNRAREVYD